jgi:hypothetical protein
VNDKSYKIELTPEQRKQIQQATGKDVPAVKLSLGNGWHRD